MLQQPATNPDEVRSKLLAALSAAGGAVTGMAEALHNPATIHGLLSWSTAYDANPEGELLPLGEDVIEPLLDAVACVINACGLPKPLHRIAMAIERFQLGDDD